MSGAIATAGLTAYDLAFQITPIILVGGIASTVLGGAIPVIALTGQLAAFGQGLLSSDALSPDNTFARYVVIPGGSVINQSVATGPFANQVIAANATIQQPNTVSLRMIAPVKSAGGYLTKTAIFSALQTSFEQHNNSGGTYTIATPAFIYTNGLMTGMRDITSNEGKQVQIEWQLDFFFPVISQAQANSAYSSSMSKLANAQQINGPVAWSGPSVAAGTAMPGALSAITGGAQNFAGGVNTFLSSPL